jgi:hypothetical protein
LQWQRPCIAWWKCNVNESFFEASGSTGCSWCVCNAEGAFIAVRRKKIAQKLTTLKGEALAILEALRVASSRRYRL